MDLKVAKLFFGIKTVHILFIFGQLLNTVNNASKTNAQKKWAV